MNKEQVVNYINFGTSISEDTYFENIHKVKPGITSWGMVRFGYASTVNEMVDRLRYDIIYIENILWNKSFIIYNFHYRGSILCW